MVSYGDKNLTSLLERSSWCVLGLPFDAVNMQQAVDQVIDAIDNQQACFLSTPNLNFAIACQHDADFYQSVVDSDLSIADGMPLIWMAKLLGLPIKERVAGSSLFEQLSSTPRQDKINVFFFGGEQGVAEQALEKLNASSAGMLGCGFYDPGFVSVNDMSTPEIIEKINASQPDFLVIALGAKKGQAWIQKNRHQLNSPVISHLGAVINFVAGSVERAPILWQRAGLEWLWRIRQEPALWKRYLFDGLAFLKLFMFKVLPLALYDRWLKRVGMFNERFSMRLEQTNNGRVTMTLAGSIHNANLEPLKHALSDALLKESDVDIACSEIAYIDSAFIGTLLLFQRNLNENGSQLTLTHVPKRIYRILNLNNVLNRFIFLEK